MLGWIDNLRRSFTFERDFDDTLRWAGFTSLTNGAGIQKEMLEFYGDPPEKWDWDLLRMIHAAERETGITRGRQSRQRGSTAAAEHVQRCFYLYRRRTGDQTLPLSFAGAVADACMMGLVAPEDWWKSEVERYKLGRTAFFEKRKQSGR